jgi:tetratricopeptide (TPR) repeat protein
MYIGDFDRSHDLLTSAQSTLETTGAVPDTSPSILYNLGFIAFHRGNYDDAEQHWKDANHLSKRDGVMSVRAECLAALGILRLQQGKVCESRQLAAQALRLVRKAGALTDERLGLEELLARLRYESGRRTKAMEALCKIAVSARCSDIPLFLKARLTQFELTLREGLHDDAAALAEDISAVAAQEGASWWIEQAESVAARFHLTQRPARDSDSS